MARVNIDEDFFSEGKLRKLANDFPDDYPTSKQDIALGIMVRLWKNSQSELVLGGSKNDIIQWAGIEEIYGDLIFKILVRNRRIVQISDDFYRISGNEKHVERLKKLKEFGKLGGLKSLEKRVKNQPQAQPQAQPKALEPQAAVWLNPITITNTITDIVIPKGITRRSNDLPAGVYEDLIKLWNENSGPLPKIQKCTASRKTMIRVRLHENPDLEYWRDVFIKLGLSEFAVSRKWASFDWVMKNDKNHVKVSEGNYDNNKQTPKGIDWAKFDKMVDEEEKNGQTPVCKTL